MLLCAQRKDRKRTIEVESKQRKEQNSLKVVTMLWERIHDNRSDFVWVNEAQVHPRKVQSLHDHNGKCSQAKFFLGQGNAHLHSAVTLPTM